MAVGSCRTAAASPPSARLRQSLSNPACTISLLPSPLAQHSSRDRPQTMGLFLLLCREAVDPSTFHGGGLTSPTRQGGMRRAPKPRWRVGLVDGPEPHAYQPDPPARDTGRSQTWLARRAGKKPPQPGSVPAGELAEHVQADALALLGVELRGEHVVPPHR